MGRAPFQGESTHAVMMQHINAVPIPPNMLNPHISPLVSAVLLRGLAKNPADRFPTATALAEALSDATQISVPLEREAGKWEKHAEPILSPGTEPRLTAPVPPLTPSPVTFPSPSLYASFHTTPGASMSNQGESDATVLRAGTTPHLQSSPVSPPSAFVPPVAPPPAINGSGRRKRGGYIVLVLSLLVVLIGGGLGLFFVLNTKAPGHAILSSAHQIVGHAFFISSGQIKESSSQGITDELQIDLTPISDPPSGKSYYGWLLPDKGMNMTAPLLLGNLVVTNGQIHSFYPGDPHHDNLLETVSRFLITTEEANLTPVIPSPDTHAWYYTAEFPQSSNQAQTPTPMLSSSPTSGMAGMSDLSVLAHLRHLLAEAPELKVVGLEGGLDIWLFRNTQKVLESAGTARDDWQVKATPLLHRHLIRILDYLDGVSFVHTDAPDQPILVPPETARIGLLDADPAHLSAGLLHEIDIHLNAMIQSPGFTAGQRALAIRIDAGIKNAIFWLEKVRQDTQQLVNRTNDQLGADPVLSDLDSIASEALNAFAGRIDPATGNVQEGVIQVHFSNQRLATFDVQPYQA